MLQACEAPGIPWVQIMCAVTNQNSWYIVGYLTRKLSLLERTQWSQPSFSNNWNKQARDINKTTDGRFASCNGAVNKEATYRPRYACCLFPFVPPHLHFVSKTLSGPSRRVLKLPRGECRTVTPKERRKRMLDHWVVRVTWWLFWESIAKSGATVLATGVSPSQA